MAVLFVLGSLSLPGASVQAAGLSSADALEHAANESRACGLEDDGDAAILCGAGFLDALVDPARLVMSRDTCSRLLEELFANQACGMSGGDCGAMSPAAPPPVAPRVAASFGAALAGQDLLALAPARSAALRAGNERVPPSHIDEPASPPPRA